MSSLRTCAGCTTRYAVDLSACPHCGSAEYTEDGSVVVGRRFPAYVTLACDCGCGPWQFRLPIVATGLVQLPTLHCASCGSRVQIPWPPKENAMPKITRHGGATNARDAESSPDVDASQLLPDGAEAVREERPVPFEPETAADGDEQSPTAGAEAESGDDAEATPDYDGMTLAELREEASRRSLPSYGTKAQVAERLRGDDLDEE